MITKLILIIFLSIQVLTVSEAHPVAYAGSNSIMTWNSKEMSDWMLTHTFTSSFSLSSRYQRIETTEGERIFYIPHINFLLNRWNELDSQANIYISAGLGGEKTNASFRSTTFLAVESDWESRKLYVSFREEILINTKNNKSTLYMTRVRGGFAPYLGDFKELNSWIILQIEKNNKGMDNFTITPLVRLFYQNVLTEFGADQNGNAQFNFMVHF